MRAWQDRGEVLDSDDEEAVFASPSRAAKTTWKTAASLEDLHRHSEEPETSSSRLGLANVEQTVEDEPWMLPQPAALYGKQSKLSAPQSSTSISALARQTENLERSSQLRSSQSDHSASLPDIRDILADGGLRNDRTTPQPYSVTSTPLSSPLSIREISPSPPPAIFRFPMRQNREERYNSTAQGEQLETSEQSTEAATAWEDLVPTSVGKRNLRVRNEKQMHPYLFDKAQHQKQFRDHGYRPVRVVTERGAAQTDYPVASQDDERSDQSFIDESTSLLPSSSNVDGSLSMAPALSSPFHMGPDNADSEKDLPDINALVNQPVYRTLGNSSKRRKISHGIHSARAAASAALTRDEFSIPPSPPSTRGGKASRAPTRPAATNFKLPRGLTPDAPLTPEISSDPQADLIGSDQGDQSEHEPSSPRRQQSSTPVAGQRTDEFDHVSESSHSQEEADVNQQQMQPQSKRVKGVLPASWLKVDLRAQKPPESPSSMQQHMLNSASPPKTAPQKGVAQRVFSKSASFAKPQHAIVISDEEEEEEDDGMDRPPSPAAMRQLKLDFRRDRHSTAPTNFADDDSMEVDWIDPMLDGSSRVRSGGKHAVKRRSKIKEPRERGQTDFSEERAAMSRITGASRTKGSGHERGNRRMPDKTKAPRLSIVDAPRGVGTHREHVPQFIRVAARRARKQPNLGRHSPSGKYVRLATRDETAEASHVLRSWREGTIMPHQPSHVQYRGHGTGTELEEISDGNNVSSVRTVNRTPLEEMQHNRQTRLPIPLSKVTTTRPSKPPGNHVSWARTRQIQLNLPNGNLSETTTSTRASEQSRSEDASMSRSRPNPKIQRAPAQPLRYREAQIESLEGDFSRDHRAAIFKHRMHCLTESVARLNRRGGNDFQLARFLRDPDLGPDRANTGKDGRPEPSKEINEAAAESDPSRVILPRRPRKRQSRRIDAEVQELRQPSEPLPVFQDIEETLQLPTDNNCQILHGLGPFGTRYATDFDVLPLPLGTFFHESSFIGSGDFAASLNFADRDLDTPTGRIRIHIDSEVLNWGAWTEDVAVGLNRIPGAISDAFQTLSTEQCDSPETGTQALVLSNVDYLLRSVVRYFTRCLAFLDPVDRRECIHATLRMVQDLLESVTEHQDGRATHHHIFARCAQYAVILSTQLVVLCQHASVQPEDRTCCQQLLARSTVHLAKMCLPEYLHDLHTTYEANKHSSRREAGLRDTDTVMCSIVILYHVTQRVEIEGVSFWTAISQALLRVDPSALSSVSALDKVWYDLLTIQPALEIDVNGILRTGSRFQGNRDGWTLPKCLVERLFGLYAATSTHPGTTVNDYIRSALTRCFVLINRWGWWSCESLLGTAFDFFARRGLAQLHNEGSHGSPAFLSDLSHHPQLEVQAEDRSFAIFLKMLASGLHGLKKHNIVTSKKIGGIAWRFIPNHGRTHRKDAELRQADLDALRNHHDLLCTLYYAAPAGHRLRPSLIQNLVDHSSSHREVCRLNIRAWSNLASFQASTDEPSANLEPFNSWISGIITTTISQYRLARTEVEQEAAAATAEGMLAVSSRTIEDTITRNQRQIAMSLVETLSALRHVLQCCSTFGNVLSILEGCGFQQVLTLFEPSDRRLHGTIQEALRVAIAALDLEKKFRAAKDSQPGSEESQEYGDSSALQEFAAVDDTIQPVDQDIATSLQGPLANLVSNVFGADTTTDDTLLTQVIDVWIGVAHRTIAHGTRTWASYIAGYSSDAWSQLRDTEQHHKYTPYFLSRVAELGDIEPIESGLITEWLRSLVAREAALKFQHKLTSALLNRYPEEPLLFNLPFMRNSSGEYNISLHELRQRRLAMLSAVLSNMYDNFDRTLRQHPSMLRQLRQTYADMLVQMMQAMKRNYQSLQPSGQAEVASLQAQGVYVEFVQQVVTLLQQYTTDICAVDRFFTDSSAFPLPATDPTYVIGRLRSYVPKLNEGRKRKELAVFIQTVSERAALDGHQSYLIDQFVSAATSTVERGNPHAPSLRHVLLSAVFPAYFESSLLTACSWIVTVPIVEACANIAEKLLYCVQMEDDGSVAATFQTLAILFQSALHPLRAALVHHGQITLPHVQKTVAAIFDFVRCAIPCVQFMRRSTEAAKGLEETVREFVQCAAQFEAYTTGQSIDEWVGSEGRESVLSYAWPDTRDFVMKQVREKFQSEWHARDGRYYVRKGTQFVEVAVRLEGDERVQLQESLRRFRESYEMIFEGRGRDAATIAVRAYDHGSVIV
ncbi:Mus7/MMS22 family-domain-containing protein [Neohortaea acidophila]|uniref:Mus7/MMS22 family-domain-containing protein n=1 Tax=Neohortaea acidophila TaxID=245834 RepID=A0A6A6PGE7_9PEZI|nr:Mus7/MMS22 family-domain-containing protein [Neohortaea acidophila]KAF2479050.1 Mus7/MMS22 family-domain-containing protein [Neohortaea acidophila]